MVRRTGVVALLCLALLLPAYAPPAHAVAPVDVPRLGAVAKIYPHVKGGDLLPTDDPVTIYPRRCDGDPAVVRRAAGNQGDYFAPDYTPQTRRTPGLTVRSARFPRMKQARLYAARFDRWARTCLRDQGQTSNVRFDVGLGDAGWGRSISLDDGGETTDAHLVLARKGTVVIMAFTTSADGTAPPRRKAVRLAALALRGATR